jgi:hypothetical protein
MKTTSRSLKLLQLVLVTLPIAIAAVFLAHPASSNAHDIVFTELSSASLTATFDGSTTGVTVLPTNPNQWTVTFLPPGVAVSFLGSMDAWAESESALGNIVNFSPRGGNSVTITSDAGTGLSINRDGFIVDRIGINAIDPDSGTNSINATFVDKGDGSAAVPDAGTTFSLFGLSLTGLAFLRSKLS